jgi:hypothetical protein
MRISPSTVLLIAALAAAPLSAQEVVDQNQPVVTSGYNSLDHHVGQTFVQSGANISGVGIFIKSIVQNPASGTVQFTLYDAIPTPLTTPGVLASGSYLLSLPTLGSGWVDFHFAPYSLTPGTSLFLMVTGSPGGFQTTDAYDAAGNAYTPGQAYTLIGATYTPLLQYDLTFRTYTTLAEPITTPEPASLAMFATGLIGIAGVARRRSVRAS